MHLDIGFIVLVLLQAKSDGFKPRELPMLCYTREARTRKPQHSLTSCSIRVLRCLSVSFRSCPFRAASDVAAPAGHLCECFGTALRKESVPVPLLTLFGVQGLLLRTGLQELQQQGRFAVLKVGVRTYINTYTYTYIYIYIYMVVPMYPYCALRNWIA